MTEQPSKSNLSPPRKFTINNSFEDTQFNKLILGSSNVSVRKQVTPEKNYLNDFPCIDHN